MDISVLLATYCRDKILYRTLQSFCSLDTKELKWEVLVVDNADDEKTREVFNHYQKVLPIKYLFEPKRGKTNAMNTAVEIAKGKLLVFTDDDIIADRNWLIEIWEGSKRWPDYSIFGGRILPEFPPGKIPIPKEHPFFNGAFVVADWNCNEGPYKAENVWGPNMAVSSFIFRQGWRFNPNLGPNGTNYLMGDETEFVLRLERQGIKPVYLPKSLVYHQIRPEQLKAKWLYRRAFITGRSRAWKAGQPNATQIFGVPRFLIREFVENKIKQMFYLFRERDFINYGIEYWITKGMIYQYKKGIYILETGD